MTNITINEAYLLGLLYGKGNIIEQNNMIRLCFNLKYRRPSDKSLRTDNVHTELTGNRKFASTLQSRMFKDFSGINEIIKKEWNIQTNFDIISNNEEDWSKKEMVLETVPIDNKNERLCELFNVKNITCETLLEFPYHLNMEKNKSLSLSFIQGVCDSCSLLPNEASNRNGNAGKPRIQLEPSQDRWKLCIGLCRLFQIGLNIPVDNINWGHPQIRTSWIGQNHQFRVYLSNIPKDIELYRLSYKREEYKNLYARECIGYVPNKKRCPYSKRIKENETIHLIKSKNQELNSEILPEELRGISIDVKNKKSICVCKLLGCKQCEKYFNIIVDKKK